MFSAPKEVAATGLATIGEDAEEEGEGEGDDEDSEKHTTVSFIVGDTE